MFEKINECNGLKGADLEAELAKVGVEEFSENLYCPEVPEADMIVRTSGEERISGFLLWRAAYAEFLFLKKYFPEMGVDDFAGVLEEYKKRGRRFGK